MCEGALGEIVEAEFHFDHYNPALSPKQHKETVNAGAGMLKDLGHLIDQALHLGVPNCFMPIFEPPEHSLW
jgi:predicted dehydrogenase